MVCLFVPGAVKRTMSFRMRGQQVVARMLKGILNVSDVVAVPDSHGEEKYYSWKTPLDKISDESTKEQVEAEQMLLRYLFNSRDHMFNRYSDWANNGRYKDGKLVHFDFGEDAYRFLEAPSDRDSLLARLRNMRPKTLSSLRDKVTELQARFEGESGKAFFRSITEASDGPVTELFGPSEVFEKYPDIEPLDLLHQVLVGRIVGLKHALDQIDRPE